MRKVFMISFDRSSDRIIDHLVPILSSTPYPIYYTTSEIEDYKVLGQSTPIWEEEDFDADDLIGEDRAIYNSLSGRIDPSKSPVSAHLLRSEEVSRVEDLVDPVERGDLVISFLDISSKDRSMVAAYFSSVVLSREAFSLCFLTMKEKIKNVKHLEVMNREFLDLSMSFNGLVALSNRVIKSGNFINIAHMIRHLVEMNFRSGVINLDQADLLSTSRGGSVLIMTWGAARPGGNPAATSTKDALSNPLCDIDLSTIRKALINVTGPSDLALEDSLVASEVLRKRTKDNARIIWGVNILQDLGEDMEVFIILSTTPMEMLLHWYSHQR